MTGMKIVGAKLSAYDVFSKFIYEKNGSLFIRSGEDDFVKGQGLQCTLNGACEKWGFYKVENPPTFRDGQELMDNVKGFEMTTRKTIKFTSSPFK